jgi:leader peptidase (prepilin peptidase) / N-methyltransferase
MQGKHARRNSMSLTLYAAIAGLILASPFAGRAAVALITAGLAGLEAQEERCAGDAPLWRHWGAGVQAAFFAGAVWASLAAQREAVPGAILLCWLLIVLSIFDLLAFVLPGVLTYALLIAGLAAGLLQGQDEVLLRIAGAVAGGGCLLFVALLYRLAAKRDGLGLGDVKLFAAAGAWVGIEGLPQVLLYASLLGLLYAFAAPGAPGAVMGNRKIPFGAGLCLSFWITWLYGPVL